jgi:hypothetical protein
MCGDLGSQRRPRGNLVRFPYFMRAFLLQDQRSVKRTRLARSARRSCHLSRNNRTRIAALLLVVLGYATRSAE